MLAVNSNIFALVIEKWNPHLRFLETESGEIAWFSDEVTDKEFFDALKDDLRTPDEDIQYRLERGKKTLYSALGRQLIELQADYLTYGSDYNKRKEAEEKLVSIVEKFDETHKVPLRMMFVEATLA